MIRDIRLKLQGLKTYAVSGGAILTAVGAYLDGSLGGWGLLAAVLAALGVITVKAGQNRREALMQHLTHTAAASFLCGMKGIGSQWIATGGVGCKCGEEDCEGCDGDCNGGG